MQIKKIASSIENIFANRIGWARNNYWLTKNEYRTKWFQVDDKISNSKYR